MGIGLEMGKRLVREHARDLKSLVQSQVDAEREWDMWRDQYALVNSGWQIEVHRAALRALKQASLLLEPRAFGVVLNRILSVSDPLHRFWLARWPRRSNMGNALEDDAPKIYARPVARRWRRVFRFLRWVARIPQWLLAFNEIAFRPDAMAVEHAAKRFKLSAATMQAVA